MYSIIKSEEVLTKAMALTRGCYQRNLLLGREALSGSTLRGAAKSYICRYRQSGLNLLARCQSNGLPITEIKGKHNKRIILIG
jgi:hypothetical protein